MKSEYVLGLEELMLKVSNKIKIKLNFAAKIWIVEIKMIKMLAQRNSNLQLKLQISYWENFHLENQNKMREVIY